MQRSRIYLGLFFIAVGAGGCAGTNRDAQSPDANEAVAQQTESFDQTRTSMLPEQAPSIPAAPPVLQNQAASKVPPAVRTDPPRKENGEIDIQAMQAQEEARDEAERNAREQAKWEKLGREQDRKNTLEYAQDRLAKANERVTDAQNQSSRVTGQRRLRFNTDVLAYQTRKSDVERRIFSLDATGNDEWKITKDALDDALDQLDALSWRVAGDL